ncbi:MAG: hypothetical protein QM765_07805 [Myxococcales bacterium]
MPSFSESTALFFLKNAVSPIQIDCEPDPELPEDLDEGSDEWVEAVDEGQFRSFFFTLDTWAERGAFEQILDVDGEANLVKVDAIAVVEVPHWLLGYEMEGPLDEPEPGEGQQGRRHPSGRP